MSTLSIDFAPWLPAWLLIVLAVLALLVTGYGIARRLSGAFWRLLFCALALVALANPQLLREKRTALDDIVLLAVDRSPSQLLGDRAEQTEAALAALRARLESRPGIDLREVQLDDDGKNGTRLVGRIAEALGEIDRSRLAGIVALTDGQVHDVPADPAAVAGDAPFHVLLTGREDEIDRQVVVEDAPNFGMVGEPLTLRLKVSELPASAAGGPVPLTLRQDGRTIATRNVMPGETAAFEVVLDKAGQSVIEAEVPPLPDEITLVNNRVALFVNGIRDRLRVLLVSGRPYPGLRVWRNLLKADPAVDLVHFTILRPPEKQDGTPIRELALIAFPSRELFEVKLPEFDLVIFDRYERRGLLPLVYLDNIARYVEQGGALLEAAGPEFADNTSLYRTPLARVLPGRPTGEVLERGFRPALTPTGRLHPVTAGLDGAGGEAADSVPGWGQWYRQIDVEAGEAQVLMTGIADRPLLLLKRVGEGRVAQLLSDHAWLWARGLEGGGPHALLLRRLVHWLMREPELEEEALRASAVDGGLLVERQSLAGEPVTVEVTSPGGVSERHVLELDEDGMARGRIAAPEDGIYRIADGRHVAYASPRPIATRELADMRSTAEKLAPLAEASGGGIVRLAEDGMPDIRFVAPERRSAGRGWIGLDANGAYRVDGASQTPLMPPLAALFLLLGTAAMAWWREGRG